MSFAADDELIAISVVAALFQVSTNTIRRWADEGKLPSHRTLGGRRRFLRSEVEAKYREMLGQVAS